MPILLFYRSKALNQPVTNLKLQKILYFLNAIYLVKRSKPLVDATFEKWNYGPTIPDVYKEYRVNGGNNIIDIKTHPILYFEDNSFYDTPLEHLGFYESNTQIYNTDLVFDTDGNNCLIRALK